MRITDALQILQQAPDGPAYEVLLACGFTPLHLETFLAAHLQLALPGRRVRVRAGLYGNPAAALETQQSLELDAVAIPLEWFDLDPRLGYRSAGNWGRAACVDIVRSAAAMLDRLEAAIERLPKSVPIALSLPTLPFPPLFHTAGWQSAEAELTLQAGVAAFASRISRRSGLSIVSAGRVSEFSPHSGRYDLKSDVLTGLPYTLAHASAVAEALSLQLAPPAPKKGLITDLDDTLWYGLVGEVGTDGIGWGLEGRNQAHGLYQKLLSALADEGTLIGIASKNDPVVVRKALERQDLLLKAHQVFPIEAHWEPKSVSVGRILRAWNIGADNVVFVDDSPMELAEVAAAHPGIETLAFPTRDYARTYEFLRKLRDLFGRPHISSEDAIRLESIRQSAVFHEASGGEGKAADSFLQQIDAVATFDFECAQDPRVLELVNKTNQFNLNGVRRTKAEWESRLSQPEELVAAVNYQDKFGPLGKISVLQGRMRGADLHIETWVMSCRAFSRRIEYQCLKMLFETLGVENIAFEFAPTPKNGPLQDFFEDMLGRRPSGPFRLARAAFEKACPPLYHRVEGTGANQWIKSQPA